MGGRLEEGLTQDDAGRGKMKVNVLDIHKCQSKTNAMVQAVHKKRDSWGYVVQLSGV